MSSADSVTLLIGEPVTESYEGLQNLIGELVHGEPWSTRQVPKSVGIVGAWLQNKWKTWFPTASIGGSSLS